MAATFNQRMLEPLTVVIARAFEVDVGLAVLVSPAFTLPYALGQLVLGPLADSFGKVRVLRASLLVLALAGLAAWFATDFATLIACRLIAGAAAGGLIPVALALIGDRVPQEQRQVAMSHFMSVLIITQIYTPPLSSAVAQWTDWHVVFLLSVLISAISLTVMFWQIQPNTTMVRPPFSVGQAIATYRTILQSPVARACFAAVLAESLFIFGFSPHIAPYIEANGMGGVVEAGYILAVFGLGGIVYSIIVGPLARRFSVFTLMRAGTVIVTFGLLVIAVSPVWWGIALAYFPIGFGFYMLHSGIQSRVTEVLPGKRASVVSLHAFFMFLGFAVGPLLFGALSKLTSIPPALVLCALAIFSAGIVVSLFLQRRAA